MNSLFNFLYTFNSMFHDSYQMEYEESVFPVVGIVTVFMALGFCLVYYAVLGRITTNFSLRRYWLMFLILTALCAFAIAFFQGKALTYSVDGYLLTFSLLNVLYSIIYFFLFSLLGRKISKFSKVVPF